MDVNLNLPSIMPLVFMGTKKPATLKRTAGGTGQGVEPTYNRDTNPTNANGGVTWEGNAISPDGQTLYNAIPRSFSMVDKAGRRSNDGHHIDASLSDKSKSQITENMTPYTTKPGSVNDPIFQRKGNAVYDAKQAANQDAADRKAQGRPSKTTEDGAAAFRDQLTQQQMGGAAQQEAIRTGQAPQDGVIQTNDQGNLAFKNGKQVGQATFSDRIKNRKR